MKKHYVLPILILLNALCSFAFADENYANVQKLKKTTLCVVIDDENIAAYKKLKDAVEKFWTFNKYQFIKSDEIGKYISDPKYSVMSFVALTLDPASTQMKSYYSIGSFGLTKETIKRFSSWSIYIFLGDKKNEFENAKGKKATRIKDLNGIISEFFPEEDMEIGSFDHLVAHVLKQNLNEVNGIFNKLKLVEYGVRGTSQKDGKIMYYNDGKDQMQNKVLLVDKAVTNKKMTKEKYAEVFNIPVDNVKVVSKEEIAKAIESGDENVNYILHIKAMYNNVYSAKDSKALGYIR